MIEYGILTSEAVYWIHLHPLARNIYCYSVSDMRYFINLYDLRVVGANSRNGRKTGEGYLVSKHASVVREKLVPATYLENINWKKLTDRQAGLRGQNIVLQMLNDGFLFPTARKPFRRVNDKENQFSGIDIVNDAKISIEVKTETFFPTDNLFVQRREYGHDPHILPDGTRHVTELPTEGDSQ